MIVYISQSIRDDNYKTLERQFSAVEVIKRIRNIADGDGTVSFDVPTNPVGLFIDTDKDISVTINSVTLTIADATFMRVTDLTSLSISCSDADGASVTVTMWGT